VLSLAVKACRQLLDEQQLDISEIDTIICSTGTPPSSMTPSLACRILKELSPDKGETLVQAYDINAACTGWLYALQGAFDTLKYDARRKIIVVTAETLSPLLDQTDPETAFIFGDAATAALLSCDQERGGMRARLHRPVLSAMGVEEDILRVPFANSGETVGMKGTQVFRVAVRKMVTMLEKACQAENVQIDDLDMIVTHQANERIIEAARKMIKFNEERVFNQMREYGNTSSNTIPIALRTVIPAQKPGAKVGLTAFGGGYTFGAAVIEVL
jgi:2-oxoisovalerate dehydrogenase E1 component